MIPSARFGQIYLDNIIDNEVVVHLFALYEEGIDEVAHNKSFCLWILTESFSKLRRMYQNQYGDSFEKKIKTTKEASRLLQLYHGYAGFFATIDFENQKECLEYIYKMDVKLEETFRYDLKKSEDLKELNQMLALGFDEEKIEKGDEEKYKELGYSEEFLEEQKNKREIQGQDIHIYTTMTQKTFKEYKERGLINSENKFINLPDTRISNNQNEIHLHAKIILPASSKYIQSFFEQLPHDSKYEMTIPRDEDKFHEIAEKEILSFDMGDIDYDSISDFQEEAYLSFKIKNKELALHTKDVDFINF